MGATGKRKKQMSRSDVIRLALILFDVAAVNLAYGMALVHRCQINLKLNEWAVNDMPAFWRAASHCTVFCLTVFTGLWLYTRCRGLAGMEDMNRLMLANADCFRESWESMLLTILADMRSKAGVIVGGVHRQCADGWQAALYIAGHDEAMHAERGRLVMGLQTPLTLMYITNDPIVAQIAEKNGVKRVWIDLETLGKEERQRDMNTVKSHHSIHDIEVLSKVLTTSDLLVRVNPMNPGTEEEINRVIAAGAEIIMLPMWKSVEDVKRFLGYVDGRAKTTLLLETREAVDCLDQVLALGGFDEIHIGLNDLHLSYGLSFMFELLANGTVESLCRKIAAAGIPYGFGGIARIGEGLLPAEWIVKEHYRLGSTRAIVSRSFCDAEKIRDIKTIEAIFAENIARLRDCEHAVTALSAEALEENREAVKRRVAEIVSQRKGAAAQRLPAMS